MPRRSRSPYAEKNYTKYGENLPPTNTHLFLFSATAVVLAAVAFGVAPSWRRKHNLTALRRPVMKFFFVAAPKELAVEAPILLAVPARSMWE